MDMIARNIGFKKKKKTVDSLSQSSATLYFKWWYMFALTIR